MQLAARLAAERIHRVEAMELYAVDRDWLASVAAQPRAANGVHADGGRAALYLSLGEETLSCVIERIAVGADRGQN